MTWQPIATVPRDGTPVLLLSEGGDRGIGFAVRSFWSVGFLEKTAWVGPYPSRMSIWLGGESLSDAIAWMPLPDPPKEAT